MKWRVLFVVSLLMNLGLLIVLTRGPSVKAGSGESLPATTQLENAARQVTVTNYIEAALESAVPTPARKLLWRDLTHPDWFQYQTNLAAVGCPPATVRDVIVAELEQEFIQRRGQVLAGFHPAVWNEIVRPDFEERIEALVEEMRALENAHKEQMNQVLGSGSRLEESIERLTRRQKIAATYGDIPPERAEEIHALETRYRAADRELRERATGRIQAGEDRRDVIAELNERTATLKNEQEAELNALLTGEEKTAARLQENGASSWAENARGFEPTAAEWTEVAQLIDTVSGEFADQYPDEDSVPDREERDERRQEVRREQAAEMDRRLAELLGAERYAEFTRAKDRNYSQVYQVTERLSLPQTTANEAYEMISTYNTAFAELQERELGEERERQAVDRMKAELARELKGGLGDEAYELYLRHGGGWIGPE